MYRLPYAKLTCHILRAQAAAGPSSLFQRREIGARDSKQGSHATRLGKPKLDIAHRVLMCLNETTPPQFGFSLAALEALVCNRYHPTMSSSGWQIFVVHSLPELWNAESGSPLNDIVLAMVQSQLLAREKPFRNPGPQH